jgi:purine-binding chemotaxis protein CheW
VQQLIVFVAAGDSYGLPLACVREVVAGAPLRSLPEPPEPWVVGIADVRGELVAVVDLGVRLGTTPGTEASQLLIVESGDGRAAIPIERVDRLAEVERLEPLPEYATDAASGLAADGDDLVLVLRPEALMPPPAKAPEPPPRPKRAPRRAAPRRSRKAA